MTRTKKECSDDGCDRPAQSRGMCSMHYLRWTRSTPPAERPPRNRPTNLDRFFSFVNKMGPIARNDPSLGRCWVWTGGDCREYGIFWADNNSHRAHVWSYKTFVGPIPEGLELDHFACNRPSCVNPAHVRPATPRVNVLRSNNLAAQNAEKTHCPEGHPYDEANTRINNRGARVCITCYRKNDRETKKAKRDAAKAAKQAEQNND